MQAEDEATTNVIPLRNPRETPATAERHRIWVCVDAEAWSSLVENCRALERPAPPR